MLFAIHHSWTGHSRGAIESILAGLETYSPRQMMAASSPLASCIPDAGPHRPHPTAPKLPVQRNRFLGDLTFNPSAVADQLVVMRTWSLLQRYGDPAERYGDRFSYHGYTAASGWLQAWSSFLVMSVALVWIVLLSTSPVAAEVASPAAGERTAVETWGEAFRRMEGHG